MSTAPASMSDLDIARSVTPRPIVNVDSSRVVRANEWLLGAHRDIDHLEIATLIGMAAGLLRVGAPPMPRSLPIHLKGGAH